MIKKDLKHESSKDLLDEHFAESNTAIAPFSTVSQLLLRARRLVSGALETVNRIFHVNDAIISL